MAKINQPPSTTSAWIVPEWPAPTNVTACTTTRGGGVSRPPFDSFNLADHVGDDIQAVTSNRQRLMASLGLPTPPVWLRQVHGNDVVRAESAPAGVDADASFTHCAGMVCAVLTADCVPLLLCSMDGSAVAAVHVGWRGLAAGIIEASVSRMALSGNQLMAWMGPAIGPQAFEVGGELRKVFVDHDPIAARAFHPHGLDHWLADLYLLTRQRLQEVGIERVYGGHWCTLSDELRFFSYRRDGTTGRMATLIWLSSPPQG